MTKEEIKAYLDFMYDEKNEYQCYNCPANDGFDNWQGRLPCGQYRCWVTAHCARAE